MTKYIGVFVVNRATGEIQQQLEVEEIRSERQEINHYEGKKDLDLRESAHGDLTKVIDDEWVAEFPFVFVEIEDD